MESEKNLKENVIECARLREGLEVKCDMLQGENVGHNQIMRFEMSNFLPVRAEYGNDMLLLTLLLVLPGLSVRYSGLTFDFQPGTGGTAASQVQCH